ncbi:MAG: SPFH domain-containing protein [Archangium sp.]
MLAKLLEPASTRSRRGRGRRSTWLAARRFLATQTLDQILKARNELSDAIKQDVSTSAKTYGVETTRADVKDLVFPGNLREIMNRVIETERASEAKLIDARARAEVAQLEARAQHRKSVCAPTRSR